MQLYLIHFCFIKFVFYQPPEEQFDARFNFIILDQVNKFNDLSDINILMKIKLKYEMFKKVSYSNKLHSFIRRGGANSAPTTTFSKLCLLQHKIQQVISFCVVKCRQLLQFLILFVWYTGYELNAIALLFELYYCNLKKIKLFNVISYLVVFNFITKL